MAVRNRTRAVLDAAAAETATGGLPGRASEELIAVPLPQFIRDLGLAVAEANKALAAAGEGDGAQVFCINGAEIEVSVAITIQREQQVGAEVKFGLGAFSMNATYKNTFAFKEEAASKIKVSLSTKNRGA